ncbi:MAG: hypothetical protein POH28_00530 [Acidocella sp.]|nr:hypothetical protein [Acidocella sp.]
MRDFHDLFGWMRGQFADAVDAAIFPWDRFYIPKCEIFTLLAVPARIVVTASDDGHDWDIHPRPDMATKRSWCWVLPVKTGFSSIMLTNPSSIVHRAWKFRCETDAVLHAIFEIFMGPEIIDLVAFSPDLKRCYGPMVGLSPVLGYPVDPELLDGKKVRVFRDIRSWWFGLYDGVVMVGRDEDNLDWLRRCEGGIVADDVKHGDQLNRSLKRAFEGPAVLVAQ